MEQIDYADLRIKLNRNPALFEEFPKLNLSQDASPEEIKSIIDQLIPRLQLNPLLKDIDLNETDLEGCNFNGATLDDMNFSGKRLSNATFAYASMKNVILSTRDDPMEDELEDIDFGFADLTGVQAVGIYFHVYANMQSTNLTGANLSHADLADVGFVDTDLTNADLTGANLQSADLSRVSSMRGTNLLDIQTDRFTEFPLNMTGAINVPAGLNAGQEDEDDELVMMHDGDHEAIAYEIHNIFKKIDIGGYQKIITEGTTHGPNLSVDEITHQFKNIITAVFAEHEKASSTKKLEAIMTRLKNSVELEASGSQKLVSDTTKFVATQPKEFQDFYLHAFIQDCYHAYASESGEPLPDGQGMSCVKGIVERFIWIVGDAAQAMCTDACTNPVYEKLLDVFGKRKLDKNELTQEWNETVLETPEFQNKETMTKEQVKQSYLDFMKKKYVAAGLWIPNTQRMVEEEADKLEYAFESRMFGGRRPPAGSAPKKRKFSRKQKKGTKPNSNAKKMNGTTQKSKPSKQRRRSQKKNNKRRTSKK
jgi:uncharacterized protein YjbI with pentapeptide repeats